MTHLVAIGFGYAARRLARLLAAEGWTVTGTTRTAEGVQEIEAAGFVGARFDAEDSAVTAELGSAIEEATHVLVSVPPTAVGDPVLAALGDRLAALHELHWVGYFSTVGVYGDTAGAWVDETSPLQPKGERGRRRLEAEKAWAAWGHRCDTPVTCLRLPGIYGPGRSPLDRVHGPNARRVIKPGQVFNRIHVDDIAGAVRHIMTLTDPAAHEAINITDDLPAPPQDVLVYAAELLGIDPPPEISFDEAHLTTMARSFYSENKRVSNKLLTLELGYDLIYPTYREGLAALIDDVAWRCRHGTRSKA
jgi:nucleoside-diphosphate-sugar epimerase